MTPGDVSFEDANHLPGECLAAAQECGWRAEIETRRLVYVQAEDIARPRLERPAGEYRIEILLDALCLVPPPSP